jgi:biopolymer transport protein ExbD
LQLEERVRKRRLARRNATLFTQIELSGLLAVCVVLLILFMMLPGPPHQHSLPLDLAVVSHSVPLPDARQEDAIIVTIVRDGTVFFRNDKTTLDDLPGAIKGAVRNGAKSKVYVRADARARYADVEVVIGAIRQAGILDAVFVTESR